MKKIQKLVIFSSAGFLLFFLLIQSAKIYTPKPDSVCFEPAFQKLVFSEVFRQARPIYKLKMLQALVRTNQDNQLIRIQLGSKLPPEDWEPAPLITLNSFSSDRLKEYFSQKHFKQQEIEYIDSQAEVKIPYSLCNKSAPHYLDYEKTWPSWLVYVATLTAGLLWIFA